MLRLRSQVSILLLVHCFCTLVHSFPNSIPQGSRTLDHRVYTPHAGIKTRDDLVDTSNDEDLGLDDDNAAYDQNHKCDERSFASLEDLNVAAASADQGLRNDCIGIYAFDTLISMLDKAYSNYTSINDGYDQAFDYYVKYMHDLIPSVLLNDFMFDKSASAIDMHVGVLGRGMDFFDCNLAGTTDKFPCTRLREKVVGRSTTEFTLRDHDGFYKALGEVGLASEWVDFGDSEWDGWAEGYRASATLPFKFTKFPIANRSLVIPNPKDIVTKGLGNLPELRLHMEATLLELQLGHWFDGSTSDPAQAYSMPVFMFLQGIDGMAQAKALGVKEEEIERKAEEEKKKQLILLIVSIVLSFVPVVGPEVAAAAGLASLARTIAILGELGNSALAIYDTVNDPKSAPINILGMLGGLGAFAKVSRNGKGIGDVAKIRAGMKVGEVAALGKIFRQHDDKLQTVLKTCRWG